MASQQERADRALQEALERTGARDPRDFYRKRLRELKGSDPDAYEKAVTHYREVLVPTVAEGEVEPLRAWTEYGRRLAELTASGRTVAIDESGRARSYDDSEAPEGLILHLPDDRKRKALVVGLPPDLSPAQRASYDWLVAGRRRLPGA